MPNSEVMEEKEPLVGYRLFYLSQDGALKGSYQNSIWPSTILKARCGRDETEEAEKACEKHLSSGECSCGIYIVKDKFTHEYWNDIFNRQTQLEAKVTGWGICIEGTTGMRCQYTKIEELTLLLGPCPICRTYPLEYMTEDGEAIACGKCVDSDTPQSLNWESHAKKIEDRYKVPLYIQPLYRDGIVPVEFPLPAELKKK